MKLFIRELKPIIRIHIKSPGKKIESISVVDTTQDELLNFVTEVFKEKVTKKRKLPKRVNVEVRETRGAINGKSKSVALADITPLEVKEKLLSLIEK